MIITLLKNVQPDAVPESLSLVVATPKPRLIKLKLSAAGFEPFSIAGSRRRAMHYVLKPEIGGLTGLIAPLVGPVSRSGSGDVRGRICANFEGQQGAKTGSSRSRTQLPFSPASCRSRYADLTVIFTKPDISHLVGHPRSASLAQRLGVPFEFAEEPLGPLLETGVGRFSGCGERFTDPRHRQQ